MIEGRMIEGSLVPSLSQYILVNWHGQKVVRISFGQEEPAVSGPLSKRIAAYIEIGAPRPEANLDFSRCTEFQTEIYALVQQIPRGSTMTYGQVARLAGCPGAARAVGQAMAANPFAVLVPCHRVVACNGPGGYFWGKDLKTKLLQLEIKHQ